jgi:hypothetical protein
LLTLFLLSSVLLKFGWATDYTQDANCILAWLFTEGSGTTVDDASASANDGTFAGSNKPAWDSDVPKTYTPYSVLFTSTDNYVWHDSVDWRSTGNVSYGYWLKPTDVTSRFIACFANAADYATADYPMGITSDSKVVTRLWDGSASRYLFSDTALSTSSWAHIATTKQSGHWRLYFNGVEEDDYTSTVNFYLGSGFLIGRGRAPELDAYAPNDWEYAGRLTESFVFTAALTSTEINEIMDYGLKPATTTNTSNFFLLF